MFFHAGCGDLHLIDSDIQSGLYEHATLTEHEPSFVHIRATFLVLSVVACNTGGETVTTSGSHAEMVRSVAQKLGIKLPQGTEVVGVETEAGFDDAIRAKRRVPAPSGAEFLRDCAVKRFRQGGSNLLGPDHAFWDPHRARMLRSGEVTLQSGRALLVAIDKSASDALIVFAMNYST